jgi:hypothetical protein
MVSDVVNLPELATQLGSALGITAVGGQILMSFLFMAMFLLPTLYFCNRSHMDSTMPTVFVGGGTLIASVIMFSTPSWIIVLLMLMVGALWAGIARNWLSGRGN